jgi:site-specific DNA-cytosine methylase
MDTFAGCGGLSEGLKWAGVQSKWAIEWWDMAAGTTFSNIQL